MNLPLCGARRGRLVCMQPVDHAVVVHDEGFAGRRLMIIPRHLAIGQGGRWHSWPTGGTLTPHLRWPPKSP